MLQVKHVIVWHCKNIYFWSSELEKLYKKILLQCLFFKTACLNECPAVLLELFVEIYGSSYANFIF